MFAVGHQAHREPPFGQGAGLVGTGDVDPSQRLHRRQAAEQHPPVGQAASHPHLTGPGEQGQALGHDRQGDADPHAELGERRLAPQQPGGEHGDPPSRGDRQGELHQSGQARRRRCSVSSRPGRGPPRWTPGGSGGRRPPPRRARSPRRRRSPPGRCGPRVAPVRRAWRPVPTRPSAAPRPLPGRGRSAGGRRPAPGHPAPPAGCHPAPPPTPGRPRERRRARRGRWRCPTAASPRSPDRPGAPARRRGRC